MHSLIQRSRNRLKNPHAGVVVMFLAIFILHCRHTYGADKATEFNDLAKVFTAFDRVYSSAFECSGTGRWPNGAPSKVMDHFDVSFTYSRSQKRQVVEFRYDWKTVADSLTGQKILKTRSQVISDDHLTAMYDYEGNYLFSGAGNAPLITPIDGFLHVESPDKEAFSLWLLPVIWTAGRGFGDHITEIVAVSETPASGQVEIEATGRLFNERAMGRWKLTLDTNASWIVRKATFQGVNSPGLDVIITTDGILQRDDCQLPKSGRMAILKGGKEHRTYETLFENGALHTNEPLFDTVRRAVNEPYPPGTQVIDKRSDPPASLRVRKDNSIEQQRVVSVGNEVTATPLSTKIQRPWTWSFYLLLLVNIGVVGALLLLWLTRAGKAQRSSTASAE